MVFDAPNSAMKGQTNHRLRTSRMPQQLRNGSTDAERALWRRLKGRQIEDCKFRRQHPFGDYILDFVCLERMVVIELDGSQHADAVGYDARRTRLLEDAGFVVLRFWNNDVFGNMDGVLEMIHRQLVARATPSPPNSPGPQAQPSGVCRGADQWSANAPPHPLEGEG